MRGVNRLVFRFRAELAFGRRESEGPADSALFLRDIVSHRACCLWAEGGLVTAWCSQGNRQQDGVWFGGCGFGPHCDDHGSLARVPYQSADVSGAASPQQVSAKFRFLASHGTLLRRSKTLPRCDTRRQYRSDDHKRGRHRAF